MNTVIQLCNIFLKISGDGVLQFTLKSFTTEMKKGKPLREQKNNFVLGGSENVLKDKNPLHKHTSISIQYKTFGIGGPSIKIFIVN